MGIRFGLLTFLKNPHYAITSFNVLNLTLNFREEVLLAVCYDVICDGPVIPYIEFDTFSLPNFCVIYYVLMKFILSLYW
jgi:hypothetical protein